MIVLIFVLCLLASYTDFKSGKVLNKHITKFLIVGLVASAIYYFLSIKQVGVEGIFKCALNILICSTVSFLLYYLKIWGAGDAKLYFTIISLIPFNLYVDESFSVFPGFILLAVIFGLGFLYLFIETTVLFIKDLSKKQIKKDFIIVKGFNKHVLGELIWSLTLSYFFSSTTFILLMHYFPDVFVNNRGLFMFLNVFIITITLNNLKGKKIYYAVTILTITFLLLNVFIVQLRYRISTVTIISIAVYLFVIILRYIGNKYNYKEIQAKDIEEGMILSFETIFKFKTSRAKGLPVLTTENTDSRLSYEQVENIKKWACTKPENETIKVVKNLPFAPFISVGTIFFIIARVCMILFVRG